MNARRAAGGVLGALVLVFLVLAVRAGLRDVDGIKWRFAPGWLGLSVVAFTLQQCAHVELWRLMLRRLGHRVGGAGARSAWNVSNLGRYVPSGAAVLAGRVVMADRLGVPKTVTGITIVYEIALSVVCGVVLGAAYLLTLPELSSPLVQAVVLAIPVVGVAAVDPAILPRLVNPVLVRTSRPPLSSVLCRRDVYAFLAAYLATFCAGGLGVWAFAQAIHHVSAAELATFVSAYGVGLIGAGLGALLPGGLGAREASLAGALSRAVPLQVAVAVAVGSRLVQMALELALAGGTWLLARRGTTIL